MDSLAGPALLALIYAVGAYALGAIVIDALNLRGWSTDDDWAEPSLRDSDFGEED